MPPSSLLRPSGCQATWPETWPRRRSVRLANPQRTVQTATDNVAEVGQRIFDGIEPSHDPHGVVIEQRVEQGHGTQRILCRIGSVQPQVDLAATGRHHRRIAVPGVAGAACGDRAVHQRPALEPSARIQIVLQSVVVLTSASRPSDHDRAVAKRGRSNAGVDGVAPVGSRRVEPRHAASVESCFVCAEHTAHEGVLVGLRCDVHPDIVLRHSGNRYDQQQEGN